MPPAVMIAPAGTVHVDSVVLLELMMFGVEMFAPEAVKSASPLSAIVTVSIAASGDLTSNLLAVGAVKSVANACDDVITPRKLPYAI